MIVDNPNQLRVIAAAGLLAAAMSMSGCAGAGTPLTPAAIPAQTHVSRLGIASSIESSFAAAPDAGGAITLSVSKLTLYGTGKQSATVVSVSETGYKGKFSESGTCAKFALVAPTSGKGPTLRVIITGLAIGKCAMTFADAKHHKAVLPVDVKKGGSLSVPLLIPLHIGLGRHHHPSPVAPKFISPSTQAMVVQISGPTSETVVAGLTSLSPGCAITLQGVQCQFGTSLASCSGAGDQCYTATITMYDAYDATSNTIPAGAAALSISTQKFAIVDNQSNNVSFNFSGIPAQIAVVPGTPLVPQSNNVYDLVGPGAHNMFAEALDADNNVIAGSGGPSYSVSVVAAVSGPNTSIPTVTQPPAGSPRFTITPPGILQPSNYLWTLKTVATYGPGQTDACTYPGAVCEGDVSLGMQSLLAVQGGYSITEFGAEKGTGPLTTISSCAGTVVSDIEFDPSGNLFVANPYSNKVCVFSPGSSLLNRTITTGLGLPTTMTTDASGNLYVANVYPAPQVTVYAPNAVTPSQTIPFPVPSSNPGSASSPSYFGTSASHMAVDGSGNMWLLLNNFYDGAPSPIFNKLPSAASWGKVIFIPHGGTPQVVAGTTLPVGIALDQSTGKLYISDETYTVAHQEAECGLPASSPNYCKIEVVSPSAPSPAVVFEGSAYAGNLQFVPSATTNTTHVAASLLADDAVGPYFSSYVFTSPSSPLQSFFTSSVLGRAVSATFVADQLQNVYTADLQAGIVYGFRPSQFNTGSTQTISPYLTLTNGVDAPNSLAIVP